VVESTALEIRSLLSLPVPVRPSSSWFVGVFEIWSVLYPFPSRSMLQSSVAIWVATDPIRSRIGRPQNAKVFESLGRTYEAGLSLLASWYSSPHHFEASHSSDFDGKKQGTVSIIAVSAGIYASEGSRKHPELPHGPSSEGYASYTAP
jgi:hypothetical protein